MIEINGLVAGYGGLEAILRAASCRYRSGTACSPG
jgi:hypothetical protein